VANQVTRGKGLLGYISVPAIGRILIAGTAVDASAAELNKLASVTAGTVAASKAVVVDADKRVDELVIGTLKLGAAGGTAVTATAAELNILDGVSKTAAEINATTANPQQAHIDDLAGGAALADVIAKVNALLAALEAAAVLAAV
jgi:hypothetical protein